MINIGSMQSKFGKIMTGLHQYIRPIALFCSDHHGRRADADLGA